MSGVDSSVYAWLAGQPAFVEVGIGMVFVVVIAPAVLAAVAAATARLEPIFGNLARYTQRRVAERARFAEEQKHDTRAAPLSSVVAIRS